MNRKVFVTRKIPEIGIKILEKANCVVDIYPKDKIIPQKELVSTLKNGNYDAVLCLLTDKIDVKILDSSSTVKIYSNYASGFDNIDTIEAKKRNIVVANSPTVFTFEAVAEHTIALMFALAARIVEADEFVRRGKYKGWAPMNFIGTDVLGKTIGLVGAGKIGERVAHYSNGLGLKVIYHDVSRNEKIEKENGAVFKNSIEDVLREADVVSLHVPLFDSTRHLINEARLRLMKPTSFLINTSRGPVVDERALEKVLREKIITAAALDVFEFEPKTVPGLNKLQNIILTPHIASASIEARNQMAEVAANNIIDLFEGREPKNIVNK